MGYIESMELYTKELCVSVNTVKSVWLTDYANINKA